MNINTEYKTAINNKFFISSDYYPKSGICCGDTEFKHLVIHAYNKYNYTAAMNDIDFLMSKTLCTNLMCSDQEIQNMTISLHRAYSERREWARNQIFRTSLIMKNILMQANTSPIYLLEVSKNCNTNVKNFLERLWNTYTQDEDLRLVLEHLNAKYNNQLHVFHKLLSIIDAYPKNTTQQNSRPEECLSILAKLSRDDLKQLIHDHAAKQVLQQFFFQNGSLINNSDLKDKSLQEMRQWLENNQDLISQENIMLDIRKPLFFIPKEIALCQSSLITMTKCDILKIDHIETCTKLTYLDLSSNALQDTKNLVSTQITTLNLSHNKIRSIQLDTAPNIKKLYISHNKIQDIEGVKKLPCLVTLDLSNNELQDITDIYSLSNIRFLFLHHNNIENIKKFAPSSPLEILYLHHNKIKDITELQSLSHLRVLLISHNQIKTVEPLQKLLNLCDIDLIDNKSLNLTPLKDLPKLQHIYISPYQVEYTKQYDKEFMKKICLYSGDRPY